MRIKLAEIGSELPLRFAIPFVSVIYAIGLYGFYHVCPAGSECGAGEEPFTFFNNALRTFALFFSLAEPGHEALRNIPLLFARWVAPCVTLFAIFQLFAARVDVWRRARKLAQLNNHQVLIGVGDSARHLIDGPHPIVIVDRDGDALTSATESDTLFKLEGDGRDTALLSKAGIAEAKHVLIMGGLDSENLDVLAQISRLREGAPEKLRVAVRLKNPALMEQLNQQNQFVGAANLDVFAFTLDQIAAHGFVAHSSLSEMAHLRGQRRVHLLVVGWSEFALAALKQFLRISPFGTLAAPRISVVCENAALVHQGIIDSSPIWLDRTVVDLTVQELKSESVTSRISHLEKQDPLTAVLIAADDDAANSVLGLSLRQRTRIANSCFAPIFIRLKSSEALEKMLADKFAPQIDPADAVIAVGQTYASLSFENLFHLREALAKPLHDIYRMGQVVSADAAQKWENLPATFRNASIAAADHSFARIASAGYVATQESGLPHGAWAADQPGPTLEHVAELAHKAWEIERRLEGWQYGKIRNTAKLINPNLKPYGELNDEVKDSDRAQIRLLGKVMRTGTGPTTLFKNTVVAAFGHNAISDLERAEIIRNTRHAFETGEFEFVSLASPLAPGADMAIVDAALDVLIAKNIPHRLLVLQALPWQIVHDEQARLHTIKPAELDAMRAKILGKAKSSAHIVHLEPPEIDDDVWRKNSTLRNAAYRTANNWMVDHANLALCHLRGGSIAKPGGTAEAVKLFLKKKSNLIRV
jgi:RyR domain/TrkA-N domain